MGLFDSINKKQHEKAEIEAESREQTNVQQQQMVGAALNPEEDHIYNQVQESRADFLKWQQDMSEEMHSLVMTLKGYSYSDDKKLIKVTEDPLCNDKFIYDVVIPQTKPFFSKNMINSRLDENRILQTLRKTCDDIANAMADAWSVNGSKYGIAFDNHDLVLRNIKNCIVSGPFRALGGWTKRLDSSSIKRVETFQDNHSDNIKQGNLKSLFKGA